MRGANSVIGFGVFGLCAFILLSSLSGLHGFCGEKSIPCRAVVDADPRSLVDPITLGIIGLISIMLVANGLVRLSRYRRGES